jgi:DNA-directed RNA polymerase beta' subunit
MLPPGKPRFEFAVEEISKKVRRCYNCEGPQPKYREEGLVIKTIFDDADVTPDTMHIIMTPFTPARAQSILSGISPEDAALLGVRVPENLVFQELVVPAVPLRPNQSRWQSGGITKQLQKVAAASSACAKDASFNHLLDLQAHAALIVDNNASATNHLSANGRRRFHPANTNVKALIGSKSGLFRNRLSGKRTDFSARGVISPSARLDPDEVFIPMEAAATLTFPETVTALSLKRLKKCVSVGAKGPAGANFVFRPSKRAAFNLERMSDASRKLIVLQIGDVVERHLVDGDLVVMNRQPTLHCGSLMVHRARLWHNHTFGLPTDVTGPYGADYDGDEMNCHPMRSFEARAEAEELMSVSANVLSPQSGAPMFGLVQDQLFGAHELSGAECVLSREEACQLLVGVRHCKTTLPAGVDQFSGRDILSMILPPNLSMQCGDCVITSGVISGAPWTKGMLGAKRGSLLHHIALYYGGRALIHFVGDLRRVVYVYNNLRPLSIGVRDVLADEPLPAAFKQEVDVRYAALTEFVKSAGLSGDVVESLQTTFIAGTTNALASYATAPKTNGISRMVASGSKGSIFNLMQTRVGLGFQTLRAGRLQPDFAGRTLRSAPRNDDVPTNRGLVLGCFSDGLSVTDFMQHAMPSREGLVDTSVGTARTGYMQRRITKALEGTVVACDGTVRDAYGNIVAFAYGGDGLNCRFTEKNAIEDLPNFIAPFNFTNVYFQATGKPYGGAQSTSISPRLVSVCEESLAAIKSVFEQQLTPAIDDFLTWACCPSRFNSVEDHLAFFEVALERCIKSRVEHGEPVGLLAALAVGEPCTQMTLNTFRLAGVTRKETSGMPRLLELVNHTETQTKFVTVPVSSKREAEKLIWRIQRVSLRDVVFEESVVCRPGRPQLFGEQLDDFNGWRPYIALEEHCEGHEQGAERLGVEEQSAKEQIVEEQGAEGTGTEKLGAFVVRLALDCCSLARLGQSARDVAILVSDTLGKDAIVHCDPHSFGDAPCILRVLPTGCQFGMKAFATASNLKQKVLDIVVHGDESVESAVVSEDEGKWGVDIEGASLLSVFSLIHDMPLTGTFSNCVEDVAETLGIEAARNVLISEFTKVLKNAGQVDPHHIETIVDSMIRSGSVRGMTSTKMDNIHKSPFGNATFERPINVLYQAAIFEQTDELQGPTERNMFALHAKSGTGDVHLLTPDKKVVPFGGPVVPTGSSMDLKFYNTHYI